MRGGLFALGAHSDDLAFSLAGAFLDGRLAGCRPVTVYSRSGWTPGDPAGDADAVTAMRKAEDRRFFSRTPAAPPLWLDQPDASLRGIESVFTAPLRADEAGAACAAIAAILPLNATLLAPLALGEHLDHRLVREAALDCAAGGARLLFYEDLPYAAFMEEAEIERQVQRLAERLKRPLRPQWWSSGGLAAAKAWAVESYSSQTDAPFLAHLLRHAERLRRGDLPAERVWVAGDETVGAG